MQYACLFYVEENAFDPLSETEKEKLTTDSVNFDRDLKNRGHLIAAAALEPTDTATTISVRNGKTLMTRRAVCRDQGAPGGLILVTAPRSQRGHRIAAGMPVAKLGRIEVRPVMGNVGCPGGFLTDLDAFIAPRRGACWRLSSAAREFRAGGGGAARRLAAAAMQWPREGGAKKPSGVAGAAGAVQGDRPGCGGASGSMWRSSELALEMDEEEPEMDDQAIADDQLRLIFTCCHPALAPEAQVALTLREVCGLTTEEIARAFLIPAPTLAQRIVRAKGKIRDAQIPYAVPEPTSARAAGTVLQTIYLVLTRAIRPPGATISPPRRSGWGSCWSAPADAEASAAGVMVLHESRRAGG